MSVIVGFNRILVNNYELVIDNLFTGRDSGSGILCQNSPLQETFVTALCKTDFAMVANEETDAVLLGLLPDFGVFTN